MDRKRVVITEFMDPAAVAQLADRFDVHYAPDLHARRDELVRLLAEADALVVRNRTRVDAVLLASQTRLQAIGRLGVGLENIDLDHCRMLGVEVIPAIGANAAAVAEYVVCCAMMLLRGAYFHSTEVSAGAWPRDRLAGGRELSGKRLGLVGLGSVGRITATLAQAMGMHACAYDPALDPAHETWHTVERCAGLDALLGQCDVVSLHVPLLAQTRNLIDARRLSLMKPDAILINVARGGVVDEAALAAALASNRLGGAALDVYAEEPLPAGSPLAGVPNLILTPHVAGVTAESNVRVSSVIARAIAQRLGG